MAKKIDLDRIIVKMSNIDTDRQQVKNQIELQENALKFYMGMPIETQISMPKEEFEVVPAALTQEPNIENRTEYLLLKKQEELLVFNKKAVEAGYYPTLSLSAGYNYIGQGPEMPWFAKPEKGVYWSDFSAIALNLHVPILQVSELVQKLDRPMFKLENCKKISKILNFLLIWIIEMQ